MIDFYFLLAERITAYMAPLNTSYWRGFYFFGGYMKAKKLLEKLGAKGIKKILESAHQEAVYFVDEWNEHFKVHGFYTDKCIVGVHNPHSHYKLSELKQALGGEHGYKRS
ncbi:Phage protein [Acinetobacter baumannii]|nr:Uncharacterised protein [Acinetobacter baumannii]SSP03043.1 Uncharacterised protein [Acinetobacter baumannii]SSQ83110.1 Uncharacterised protein [Acinetobacter baumannii]SSS23152.1 Uncharacterised protein [Acinetobacter baumannii]SSS26319.1 Uncharacterised protein [Acinetobacter baumannii]